MKPLKGTPSIRIFSEEERKPSVSLLLIISNLPFAAMCPVLFWFGLGLVALSLFLSVCLPVCVCVCIETGFST